MVRVGLLIACLGCMTGCDSVDRASSSDAAVSQSPDGTPRPARSDAGALGAFSTPVLIGELSDLTAHDDDPTLTGDWLPL